MKKAPEEIAGQDYLDFVSNAALVAEASARLAALQAEADKRIIDILDEAREEHSKLQAALTQAEDAIEIIVSRNRAKWFGDKKSLKCPYGTAQFRKGSALEIPNEELTVELIRRMFPGDESLYIRTEAKINKEAVEVLTDGELERLRVRKVTTESFTFKPATIDLGKSSKAAAESAA